MEGSLWLCVREGGGLMLCRATMKEGYVFFSCASLDGGDEKIGTKGQIDRLLDTTAKKMVKWMKGIDQFRLEMINAKWLRFSRDAFSTTKRDGQD